MEVKTIKTQAIIITVIIAVALNLFGCSSFEKGEQTQLMGQNAADVAEKRIRKSTGVGMPNPAAVYCVKLGYKFDVVTDEQGSQYGVCIFPDGNACLAWDFYRGKSGQEWSYCERYGYDLKELGLCKN